MPSFQFLKLFKTMGPLSKMGIVTSVPISFLLLGLQAIMDIKFSCPCRVGWNLVLPILTFLVPALIALVIMLLLLRPCQYKCNCSQGNNNRGTSQGQDNRGTSQGLDNRGTSQGQDNRGTSQGQDNRGTSQGQDNRGTSQGLDNRGTSQGQDNRGTSQGQDNRGTSQGQDNRGTSQGLDNRGTSQGQDNRGTSQGQDNRGTSQGQDNRGTSQGLDNRGTSQGQDNRGTSQGQDNRGTSQSEKIELVENLSCVKAFLICCIPCFVWICIFFIDGDYLACLLTDWDGRYACDKELHPYCLNWCKPNKLTPWKNETEYYDMTRNFINISKTTGYGLAIFFSILAIIFVSLDCECRKPACCRSTDSETRQGIEGQLDQHPDNLQMSNLENANEDSSLLTQADGSAHGRDEFIPPARNGE